MQLEYINAGKIFNKSKLKLESFFNAKLNDSTKTGPAIAVRLLKSAIFLNFVVNFLSKENLKILNVFS